MSRDLITMYDDEPLVDAIRSFAAYEAEMNLIIYGEEATSWQRSTVGKGTVLYITVPQEAE